MATNPYAGLTSLVGMALRADAQKDTMRFREEDLAFRKQQAADSLAVDNERNRIAEITATTNQTLADIDKQRLDNEIKGDEREASERYANNVLQLFGGAKFNGELYIDDNGNLKEDVFEKAFAAGEDIARQYAIRIANNFGTSGAVKEGGFQVTQAVATRMSGMLPEGVQGPERAQPFGSGLSSLTGRVNPNEQTGEQLYSFSGQYADGTIAPLTQDGSTASDAPIVEATAAQIARMAALDYRSKVMTTQVGGQTTLLYRTGNQAVATAADLDALNKEDQKNLLLGQIDTVTEAMARENPEIRRSFISMLSDPDLTKDEQDEMVLQFAQDIGLDIPSILTTKAPKDIVGEDPGYVANIDPTKEEKELGRFPTRQAVKKRAEFKAVTELRSPAGQKLAAYRREVFVVDDEIDKLETKRSKFEEGTAPYLEATKEIDAKLIERNTLVATANGDNLKDVKSRIAREESILANARAGTPQAATSEKTLETLRAKEQELLSSGIVTEEMKTEAYKSLEEQLIGKENLVELLEEGSPETFERLKKEAEAKVAAGFIPTPAAVDDLQKVLEALGVTNDLRQARTIPAKEQIMLRSILAAQATPTNLPTMLEQYDAVVGIDTRTQGQIEEADRERIRITGEAISGVINSRANRLSSEASLLEQQRILAQFNDPLRKQKDIQELRKIGLENRKAEDEIEKARAADIQKEFERGEELEKELTNLLLSDEVEAGKANRNLTNIIVNAQNRVRLYTRTIIDSNGKERIYFTNKYAVEAIERQTNRAFTTILSKLARDEEGIFDNPVYMQLDGSDGKAVSFNKGANEFVLIGADGEQDGGAIKYRDVERLDATLARSLLIMAQINEARNQEPQ